MNAISRIVVSAACVGLAAVVVVTRSRSGTGALLSDGLLSARHVGEHPFTNHLIHEKSLYLLEHAHNPVDWYPWGEEAFRKARMENKPIFLSVGYSSCHWCHVMEHESFENPKIARILNDSFVCIKVDREERPDVDAVYMTAAGGGGWPLSVWLTPDLKPFLGASYFPPDQFTMFLEKIAERWQTNRQRLLATGQAITRRLHQYIGKDSSANDLQESLLDKTYEQIKTKYDSRYGGFDGAPKFPQPAVLNFLLCYYARTGAQDALNMTLRTLRKMAQGGIHDQIGGGFHRYATDAAWRVPHFEKMLYDQAQLACTYLNAYQIARDRLYADVARDILDYVQRDMTSSKGQFYSAQDADSPLHDNPKVDGEGAFYEWEKAEIDRVLDKASAAIFDDYYGITPDGNLSNGRRTDLANKNIPIISSTVEEVASRFGRSSEEIAKVLADAQCKLFAVRATRPRPRLDDKAITAWSGLMISAFARAYQVLDDPKYLLAGRKAAQFVKMELYDTATGKLLRRYRAGEHAIDGFADDYACLIQGLLDLYEASFDINDLRWAFALQEKEDQLFWDSRMGGYFGTANSDTDLLVRLKADYDGAEPSPNSVTALNLLRLSQMLDERSFAELARKTFIAFGARLQQAPSEVPQMMVAFDFDLTGPKQVVIAGRADAVDTRAMLRVVYRPFIPNKVVLLADGADGQAFLSRHLEFIRDVKMKDGRATAFVCQNHVCQSPTSDIAVMEKLIAGKSQDTGSGEKDEGGTASRLVK